MRKRKILLVDDSDISREMVRFILETRGWEVLTLGAPFLFVSTLTKERPDLALIEVNLAALSGDQLVRLARMNGRVACPLVLHSDRPVDELRELARASGADGFIPKSGNGDQLVMNLEYFLRFGSSRDSEPSSSSRGAADAPPPSSRRSPEALPRSEPAQGPPARRLTGSMEAVAAPPSSRRLSGSMDAAPALPPSLDTRPKRPGSGLYQAVVAALEIPPSSSKDQPPSSRRSGQSGQHPAVTPPSAPTPPAREATPPAPPVKRPARTKTLS